MSNPQPTRCLVIIDLQNEFLSPEGRFPIHSDSLPLLEKLPDLINAFHSFKYPVIWVRSEYSIATSHSNSTSSSSTNIPWDPTNFLTSTHSGKTPCCEKGTPGADFHPKVRTLIDTGDGENIVLTKTWYSAFKDTVLLAELQQRNITDIFICGLLTNVCVHATVTDARALGLEVILLEDCLGWRKRASHDRALRAMSKLGARISSTMEILPNGAQLPPVFDLPTGLPELYYVNGSIPSWRVMMALYEKVRLYFRSGSWVVYSPRFSAQEIRFKPNRLLVMSDPKETRLPEFLALNHRGKTPVLVDVIPSSVGTAGSQDAETITINESLAILFYLETYHNPSKPLLPPLTERAAHARTLARTQETENLHNIYDNLEDAHFAAEHAGNVLDPGERVRLIMAIDTELDYWEAYAGQAAFIAGETFGLADCALFPILAYMVHRGFDWQRRSEGQIENAWPHLRGYYERVWDRGGKTRCAQRSQPAGWDRKGKADMWKGTKNNAKCLYKKNLAKKESGT
ncbi:hypothetical protein H0H81_000766 [Sphagnurus paluster]|uniref:Isochorismatase-like domain-containing protein n=1 Tax=Sphagnurus paluster TaxID=117069 RepID=A0A9P7GMH9_9AGAR|nr:hypothetical protein H0H81_000766 [Sphagnurus paluster]